MARSNQVRITTTLFTAAAFSLALFAATGCSWFGSSSNKKLTKNNQTPEASFDDVVADSAGESFFDPFAPMETDDAAANVHFQTIAATNQHSPLTRANLGGISVYGDLHDGPLTTTPEFDGAENLMQLTFGAEGSDFDPDVSDDGKMLIYSSTRHRRTADIYVKRIGSRAVTQLTSDPGNDVMPTFSPDGARIAYSSDRSGSWDIYLTSRAGGQSVQITDDTAQELHPTWSPDGEMLAYCRLNPISQRWELWTVEADNPSVKHFMGYGLFPEWSPTQNKILFQRSRERGGRLFSVWTMDYINGEGVNPTEIISSPIAAVVNPTWAPDGKRIAFSTIPYPENDYNGAPSAADLWIVALDGSGRANLTGGRFVNLMPVWGARNQLFFISDRSGRDDIWSLIPEKAIMAASGPMANQNLANVTEDEN